MVTKSAYLLDLFLGGLPGEALLDVLASLAFRPRKTTPRRPGLWEVSGKTVTPVANPHSARTLRSYDPKTARRYWIALKGRSKANRSTKTGYGIHAPSTPTSIGKHSSMGWSAEG